MAYASDIGFFRFARYLRKRILSDRLIGGKSLPESFALVLTGIALPEMLRRGVEAVCPT